jgi:hypothetical protein
MARLSLQVREDIKRQVPKLAKTQLNKQIRKDFKRIKNQMIKEFLALPVTQELMAGPSSSNISGTLRGVTNLFAFIGFDSSDRPVDVLLELLQRTDVQFQKTISKGNRVGAQYIVNLPTPEEIFAKTPMPWALGRSWVKGIESGISGLGFLLRKNNKGRSGRAIQSRVKVRGGSFKPTPYMTVFLTKYKKKFESLDQKS